jgi:hypothetical protein
MRFLRLAVMLFFAVASLLRIEARQQSEPKTEPSKAESSTPKHQAPPKAADASPAVDAAKVTGSTFESQYFKFTYELPAGWKALDDSARVTANHRLAEADNERSTAPPPVAKKAASKTPAKRNPALAGALAAPVPDHYSLMVASPNGVESLDSPVLPRINVWAHKRVPPLDSAADHASFLLINKRTKVLASPVEVQLDGHPFVRVDVLGADGIYHSQFVAVMNDYLVGFDFRAQSEKEMIEMEISVKGIKFK